MSTSIAPADHLAWIRARDLTVLGEEGLAELASTTWLGSEAREIPGLPGRWWAEDGSVHGRWPGAGNPDPSIVPDSGVPASSDAQAPRTVTLSPGDTATVDGIRVAAFARDGEVAVRAFEPGRAARLGLTGIDRHPYDPSLAVEARVERTPSEPTPTESVDGHRSVTRYDVTLRFEVGGTALTLLAHDQGETFFAAFSDAAHPGKFRMLRIPATSPTVVDLNRAYLPPSTFSPHYVCVRPPAANRWDAPVPAGERAVVTE
ncbi:DUF1684 domain-containing protein [Demequina sp. NBRC 110054]|uniref:DUF1684 domain-containing protein n=1 Tax=Demequina sp. NBRC 110054 TaxID=1570343 RepID=UPI001356630E|nr:DUF1684 domain-containing protein [Demequina sp. NBRC 110054]